jgi:purine nucleoside phosphorylase
MNTDKIKAKYHEKFRKNTDHKKDYMSQLLERAWHEKDNHPGTLAYNRINGPTFKDRAELKALNELIKLYQLQIDIKKGA